MSRRQKIESMLEADPQDVMLRYMLAMELSKEGETRSSLEILTALMGEQPPYVPAFLMGGQQLASLGRTSEARDVYQRGIRIASAAGDDHAAGEMTGFLQQLDDGS